jgi:cytochrome P450
LSRETSRKYILDENITLDKYQSIEIDVYSLHHSELYFPNPQEFKPERFLPENKDNIIPYTYMPFGLGPRNCVGMRLGLMDLKLCLALLILKYKFINSNKSNPIGYYKHYQFLFNKHCYIQFQKR